VIFDGANIWVVNQGYNLKVDGSVTKLNSANGATLGIFPVGHHPSTAAFDGANIWVANTHDNTVTELRAKDGA
jgi:DNA-binding beta-propeller fold protein YncE